MAQKIKSISEALRRAKEEGQDVFLARLDKDQLERSGFDVSTFGTFQYVDVYLQWDGSKYQIKYEFDGDPSQFYYERPKDVGGEKYILEDAVKYLRIAQENDPHDETEIDEPSVAVISMVEKHPISPDEGAVYIYEVRPQPVKGGMRMEVFYVATFDNQVTEIVWGSGPTPKQALEVAIAEWARTGEEFNPFQKVFDELYLPDQD